MTIVIRMKVTTAAWLTCRHVYRTHGRHRHGRHRRGQHNERERPRVMPALASQHTHRIYTYAALYKDISRAGEWCGTHNRGKSGQEMNLWRRSFTRHGRERGAPAWHTRLSQPGRGVCPTPAHAHADAHTRRSPRRALPHAARLTRPCIFLGLRQLTMRTVRPA